MKRNAKIIFAVLSATILASCSKEINQDGMNEPEALAQNGMGMTKPIVISEAGMIDSAIKDFRELVGPLSLNESMKTGRREINWDDVILFMTNNNNFPGNYYHRTDSFAYWWQKRGVVFQTVGNAVLRVSNNNFADIDSTYRDEFIPYSGTKTFSPMGSNILEIHFKIPGTNQPGYVNGFGAVFSDVDLNNSTTIYIYNDYTLLGTYKVKKANMGLKHSFLGIYFGNKQFNKVFIKLGEGNLAPGAGDVSDTMGDDLVVIDDLIYSNPGYESQL